MEEPEGYDREKVEAWIAANTSALVPPFKWERLEGGHSNLTYKITDTGGKVAVIRRPPQGKLLPKAHDMGREWAVISGLDGTGVPAAQPIAFCEDPEITGAWFYVMGFVEGKPMYTQEDLENWVPADRREIFAHSYVDTLAALHALEPDDINLGHLGKREGYVARQLSIWYKSWTASVQYAELDDDRAHDLHKYLMDNQPEQEPARVVHGDYGLHNVLVGADSRIAAILDWEICTLGDPLADFAYSLNRWPQTPEEAQGLLEGFEAPPGLPDRTALATRYAEKTGRDLSNLAYYSAFNRWKTSAIIHGVYARYMAGQKSTEGVDLEGLRQRILDNLELSQRALEA